MRRLFSNYCIKYINPEKRLKVSEVFTPSVRARVNYINRDKVENVLDKSFKISGKQLFIYGYSRSGKSSLWENYCRKNSINVITSRCGQGVFFKDLVVDCFDQMNPFYTSQKSSKITYELKSGFGIEYKGIKASINSSSSTENGVVQNRLLEPTVSPSKLAHYVCSADLVWVIEDFHNLDEQSKKDLAGCLKFFVDEASNNTVSRVICIGTSDSIEELYKNNPDLRMRVAHIQISPFGEKEIREIVENGFRLLNVSVSDYVKDCIVDYSANDASLAHQLCLEICNQAHIKESSFKEKKVEDSVLMKAVKEYARSNDSLLNQRIQFIMSSDARICIMEAFFALKADALSKKKITTYAIRKGKQSSEIQKELDSLSQDSEDILRLDNVSNRYFFRNRIFKVYLEMFLKSESNKKEIDSIIEKTTLLIKNRDDKDAVIWQSLSKNLEELKTQFEE